MFGPPIDAMYVWLGVSIVSAVALGIVAGLPTTAPPSPGPVAATIDEVATSPPGSVAHRSLAAGSWRLDGRQLGLRNTAGSTAATLLKPAIRASTDTFQRLLAGERPSDVYESPAAFERAVSLARDDTAAWTTAPEQITVRRVRWRSVDVTLVG